MEYQHLKNQKQKYGFRWLQQHMLNELFPVREPQTEVEKLKVLCDELRREGVLKAEEYLPMFDFLCMNVNKFRNGLSRDNLSAITAGLKSVRGQTLQFNSVDTDYTSKREQMEEFLEEVKKSMRLNPNADREHMSLIMNSLQRFVNDRYSDLHLEREGTEYVMRVENFYGQGSNFRVNLTLAFRDLINVSSLSETPGINSTHLLSRDGMSLLTILTPDLEAERFKPKSYIRWLLSVFSAAGEDEVNLGDVERGVLGRVFSAASNEIEGDAMRAHLTDSQPLSNLTTPQETMDVAISIFPEEAAVWESFKRAFERAISSNKSRQIFQFYSDDIAEVRAAPLVKSTFRGTRSQFTDIANFPRLYAVKLEGFDSMQEFLKQFEVKKRSGQVTHVNRNELVLYLRERAQWASDKLKSGLQDLIDGMKLPREVVQTHPMLIAQMKNYLMQRDNIDIALNDIDDVHFPMHLVQAQSARST